MKQEWLIGKPVFASLLPLVQQCETSRTGETKKAISWQDAIGHVNLASNYGVLGSAEVALVIVPFSLSLSASFWI